MLPQFTVHGNTAMHLSARAASSKVGFAVPRPANLQAEELTVGRLNGFSLSFANVRARGSLWVNPVTRPADGALRAETAAGWLRPRTAPCPTPTRWTASIRPGSSCATSATQ